MEEQRQQMKKEYQYQKAQFKKHKKEADEYFA